MRVISNPKLIRRILKGTSVRDNHHLSVVVRFKRSNHANQRKKKKEYQTSNDEYDGDDEMTGDEMPSEPNEQNKNVIDVIMSSTWPISEEDSRDVQ
uniref:Uncharacterized protein n=1 Tax=Lepeophtheirus salmonis TaxID=72036 RepID=A0A0K2UCQ5_LEPSM